MILTAKRVLLNAQIHTCPLVGPITIATLDARVPARTEASKSRIRAIARRPTKATLLAMLAIEERLDLPANVGAGPLTKHPPVIAEPNGELLAITLIASARPHAPATLDTPTGHRRQVRPVPWLHVVALQMTRGP